MLRIIAGKYRHLKIESPDTDKTRPTTDRVREALMSALGSKIIDATCLDLFSGSGALGLESLSRGAKEVVFVDKAPIAIKTIKKNLISLKEENYRIILSSYEKALSLLKEEGKKFDIVYLDPPYKMVEVYEKARNLLLDYELLNQGAILVEESNAPFKGDYGLSKDYKYGTVHIRITKEIRR